jgi:hypothetical protein
MIFLTTILQVEDIFIPPQNDLDHKFKHGYVIHNKQRGLFKLDLESMRYTKAVDFEGQDCIPKSLAFVPIGNCIFNYQAKIDKCYFLDSKH